MCLLVGPALGIASWLGSAHSAPPDTAAAAPAQAPAARNEPALATFAGGRITLAQMQQVVDARPPSMRRELVPEQGRRGLLEDMVRYELLVLEATRRGYERNPRVEEAVARAAIAQMLQHDLAVPPASIPQPQVADYYRAHANELSRPPLRRASHIQLKSAAQARELIAQLQGADRRRFAALAVERSTDARTRRQGGELGYFERDGTRDAGGREPAVPRALVDAAFALDRVGAISAQPVAHDGAFSVVMLTGEMPAMQRPLAKVEGKIRKRLAAQQQSHALDALLAQLRAQAKPEIHPELLGAIALDPLPPHDIPEGFAAAPPDPTAPPRLVKPDGY